MPDTDDLWQDPTTKRWVQHVLDDMVPKMQKSAIAIHIVPSADAIDVKFCVELGAAIMLDKPILAVAFADHEIPAKLEAIADEIVYLPEEGIGPTAADLVSAAIERMMGDLEP